jgi:hypothetical protein
VTQLVETVTVIFTINHCNANPPSTVLGGTNDLRKTVRDAIEAVGDGTPYTWKTTGIFEAPEIGGGDN